MAMVMMSSVLTCTYVGQIPFGDKILPIQRTCINKPSLHCFFPSIWGIRGISKNQCWNGNVHSDYPKESQSGIQEM